MASVVSSRIDSLVNRLNHIPRLFFSEEQAGAYIVGFVPQPGASLTREDGKAARDAARRYLKPLVESKQLVRLGYACPHRHGQPAVTCLTKIISHVGPNTDPRVVFLGEVFRLLAEEARFELPVTENRRGEADGNWFVGSLTDQNFQRTWVYANAQIMQSPKFQDRYQPHNDGFISDLFHRRAQHEKDWVDWLKDIFRDRNVENLFVANYRMECSTLYEYGAAGDVAIRLLRLAELSQKVREAIELWTPAFNSWHGYAPHVDTLPERCCVTHQFRTERDLSGDLAGRLIDHAQRHGGVTLAASYDVQQYLYPDGTPRAYRLSPSGTDQQTDTYLLKEKDGPRLERFTRRPIFPTDGNPPDSRPET
jgi:hypothetical protein